MVHLIDHFLVVQLIGLLQKISCTKLLSANASTTNKFKKTTQIQKMPLKLILIRTEDFEILFSILITHTHFFGLWDVRIEKKLIQKTD